MPNAIIAVLVLGWLIVAVALVPGEGRKDK